MKNVQQRVIDAPASALAELLDSLSSEHDRLWPSRTWPPLKLDAGLTVGSAGGHGPIRYSVAQYSPGRHVRFAMNPKIGLVGYHEFVIVDEGAGRSRLVHTLEGQLRGAMVLLWPLAVRWLHEALLDDLLDNAERETTGALTHGPTRWSPWVRFIRRVVG